MIKVTPDLFGKFEIGEYVAKLLYGNDPQPRALTEDERAVLKWINFHRGEANAIPIAELAPKLGLTPRQVKDAVRSLIVEFDLPISGSRQRPFGYYMATTVEELKAASRPLEGEVFAMMQRIRSLRGPDYIVELAKKLVERVNNPSKEDGRPA